MYSLALILLAVAGPIQGDWVKLFDEAGESTYLQPRPKREGTEAMVWIRHDYRRPQPGGVLSLRDQWLFSCAHKSFTMFSLVSYDARGRVVSAQAIPAKQRRAAPVIPGSRMDKVFGAVCG
jgi:hypothetical protein